MKNLFLVEVITFSFIQIIFGSVPQKLRQKLLLLLKSILMHERIRIGNTVASLESASGTYNSNSDGSFHKALSKTTAAQWKASGQAGALNIYYPEFAELSDDVVYVRFYYEGIAINGSKSSDYRTKSLRIGSKRMVNGLLKLSTMRQLNLVVSILLLPQISRNK